MVNNFSKEEKYILDLLRCSLVADCAFNDSDFISPEIDVDKVIEISKAHTVTPFLFEALDKVYLPAKLATVIEKETKVTTLKTYRLLFLSRAIQNALYSEGIETVVLKGVATASLYPTPEYRKSGDVDLFLLDGTKLELACEVLNNLGFKSNDVQRALHHVAFESDEGIDIELHTLLAEPFDNKEMNDYIASIVAEGNVEGHSVSEKIEVLGVTINVLSTAYNAYELLLHMLQHFLRAGFGLKLLCDWVVFWNRELSDRDKELYLRLVTESRVKGFSDMVTKACIDYLGLREENVSFMNIEDIEATDFLEDIFSAEEFGHSSKDRMVGMRGSSLFDYIREFHHQTCLNYPRATKLIITLPVLWTMTLVRFLLNNRKREVSVKEVLKTAKKRGDLINELHLFK